MEENNSTASIWDEFLEKELEKEKPRLFKRIVEETKVYPGTTDWYRDQTTEYVQEGELNWQDLKRLYEEAINVYNDLPDQLKVKFKQMLIQDWVTKI